MVNWSDLSMKYPNIAIENSNSNVNFCLIDSRVHGLYACFHCILYGLFICEEENIIPIIYLGDNHLYYEKQYGENIFNYFFDQVNSEFNDLPKMTVLNLGGYLNWCNISTLEKEMSNLLINKFFRLKPAMQFIIDDFEKTHFAGQRMLGVHFRGSDKIEETTLLHFTKYLEKIDYILDHNICDKLFFATDELHLRLYVADRYKHRATVYNIEGDYSTVSRNQALHFSSASPYFNGKNAIVECYLLSRCNLFMSSHNSSMSLFPTFINPDLVHVIIEP